MKLYIEIQTNDPGPPSVMVLQDGDPAPAGYHPASDDLSDWETYGSAGVGNWYGFRDYKSLRSEIKARVNIKAGFDPSDRASYTLAAWGLLSADEQQIAADYFAVPSHLRDTVQDTATQVTQGRGYHIDSVESRKARVDLALSEVYNRLDISDALKVEADLTQIVQGTRIGLVSDLTDSQVSVRSLLDSYRERGIEGTEEDGVVGLFDYLLSRSGTPFAASGLSERGYPVRGFPSCLEFAGRLFEILSLGLY